MLADTGLAVDGGVHLRLGEAWLVALVVPVASIADQVDDEVGGELLPVGAGQPRHLDARLGIVGVDVDDGHLEALGQVAGVEGAATFPLRCREANLIIGDQMERAADAIAAQALQVQRLGDDALAGESGVAVDEYRQDDVRVEVETAGAVGP